MEEGWGRPGSKEVQKAKWIEMAQVQDRTAVQVLRSRLGAGESEVIVLAMELKANLVLIDEKRATRIAQSMGLVKAGTVGTLIAAKRAGLIPAVTPLLDRLLVTGVRLSQKLYRYAQELAGEGVKNEKPGRSDQGER